MFIVGVGQFLVRDIIYTNPDNWSLRYFFEEIRNTFLAGIFFLAIVTPIIHKLYLKQHQNAIKNLTPVKEEIITYDNEQISIKTQLKTDKFQLNPYLLLFALSQGNYTELYFLENNEFQKKLLRVSLKNLEAQLSMYPFIMRTHRSYIVNLVKIKHIQGNAQGLNVSFNIGREEALVSRKMISTFKEKMKTLQN